MRKSKAVRIKAPRPMGINTVSRNRDRRPMSINTASRNRGRRRATTNRLQEAMKVRHPDTTKGLRPEMTRARLPTIPNIRTTAIKGT